MEFSELSKQIENQKNYWFLRNGFTWNMEPILRKRNCLGLPLGRTTIPAWQQVSFDCSAVAVAAAIEKLLVKAVFFHGYKHDILRPHPVWFYAVARNQILRGAKYLSPGVEIEPVLEVIKRYGILWMSYKIPPYNLETLDAWADSIHYQRAKLAPHLYSHYFEDYIGRCEKLSDLVIVRLRTSEEVIHVLKACGCVVIESDMPLEPVDDNDGRKIYSHTNRHWGKHAMYITDLDDKTGLIARWQLWGEDGEHGEYRSNNPSYPSGMAWQSMDLLLEEFQQFHVNAYGLLFRSLLFEK
jgi:hypothetical protein